MDIYSGRVRNSKYVFHKHVPRVQFAFGAAGNRLSDLSLPTKNLAYDYLHLT